MGKLLMLFTVLLLVVPFAAPANGGEPTIHDVTMAYSNGQVVVTPSVTRAAVGDIVRITATQGEFALKFTNALTDDGPIVHSTNGVFRFTVQGGGWFACSMTINGQVAAGGYGGEIEVGN